MIHDQTILDTERSKLGDVWIYHESWMKMKGMGLMGLEMKWNPKKGVRFDLTTKSERDSHSISKNC